VGVRHNSWEIWRGVRANLPLLRGGYSVIFVLARLIFRPPPLLIIIAQSLKIRVTGFVLEIRRVGNKSDFDKLVGVIQHGLQGF